MRGWRDHLPIVGFIVIAFALGVLQVVLVQRAEADCESRGGTYECESRTLVGVSSDGKVVTTPDTRCRCEGARR